MHAPVENSGFTRLDTVYFKLPNREECLAEIYKGVLSPAEWSKGNDSSIYDECDRFAKDVCQIWYVPDCVGHGRARLPWHCSQEEEVNYKASRVI